MMLPHRPVVARLWPTAGSAPTQGPPTSPETTPDLHLYRERATRIELAFSAWEARRSPFRDLLKSNCGAPRQRLRSLTGASRCCGCAVVVAGTPRFWSVVRITAVDPDGQVHFVQLEENDPVALTALGTVV